jgi:hypothetical protein
MTIREPITAGAEADLLRRIRRNHALEHATIHLLSAAYPRRSIIGRSDWNGFYLYGELPTRAVAEAATDALSRLQSGERALAIHPNCGTNLLTAAVLACLGSLVAYGRPEDRWRDRLERLPFAVLAAAAGLIVARPLGMQIQEHLTTLADPGTLRLLAVKRLPTSYPTTHRVLTGM